MSTEIKPGQVWAWNDGRTSPGPVFRITSLGTYEAAGESTPRVNYEYVGESGAYDLEAHLIRRGAHLVTDVDATPAPLDPSKSPEYADDAVRQEIEFRKYLTAVTGIDSATSAPLNPSAVTTVEEIRVGQPGDLREGDVVVKVPTWHTNADTGISGLIGDVVVRREVPAPEPLVEGRLYEVTAPDGRRGRAFYKPIDGIRANHPWVSEDETRYRSDAVTDVRPLVVIDPADEKFDQDSLAEVARKAYNSALDVVEWETVANAIRAHLGIEATS